MASGPIEGDGGRETGPRLDKGPAEVIRALLSGDKEELAEALEFQRESFRAKFGCYPEEMTPVDGE